MKTLPGIIVRFQSKNFISFLSSGILIAIVLSTIFISCNKDIDLFNEKEFDLYIKSLPPISDAMPAEKAAEILSSEVDTTVEYIYKIDYYSVAAGYDEQIVLNPQTDVIYPGALVKGESILDGTYTLIPAKRKLIIISTSLTGAASVSIAIESYLQYGRQ